MYINSNKYHDPLYGYGTISIFYNRYTSLSGSNKYIDNDEPEYDAFTDGNKNNKNEFNEYLQHLYNYGYHISQKIRDDSKTCVSYFEADPDGRKRIISSLDYVADFPIIQIILKSDDNAEAINHILLKYKIDAKYKDCLARYIYTEIDYAHNINDLIESFKKRTDIIDNTLAEQLILYDYYTEAEMIEMKNNGTYYIKNGLMWSAMGISDAEGITSAISDCYSKNVPKEDMPLVLINDWFDLYYYGLEYVKKKTALYNAPRYDHHELDEIFLNRPLKLRINDSMVKVDYINTNNMELVGYYIDNIPRKYREIFVEYSKNNGKYFEKANIDLFSQFLNTYHMLSIEQIKTVLLIEGDISKYGTNIDKLINILFEKRSICPKYDPTDKRTPEYGMYLELFDDLMILLSQYASQDVNATVKGIFEKENIKKIVYEGTPVLNARYFKPEFYDVFNKAAGTLQKDHLSMLKYIIFDNEPQKDNEFKENEAKGVFIGGKAAPLRIYVYPYAFLLEPNNNKYSSLFSVLCHELGHVISVPTHEAINTLFMKDYFQISGWDEFGHTNAYSDHRLYADFPWMTGNYDYSTRYGQQNGNEDFATLYYSWVYDSLTLLDYSKQYEALTNKSSWFADRVFTSYINGEWSTRFYKLYVENDSFNVIYEDVKRKVKSREGDQIELMPLGQSAFSNIKSIIEIKHTTQGKK